MAICKIGGLLLRHFSIIFNGTTSTVTVRSHILYALRRQDKGKFSAGFRCWGIGAQAWWEAPCVDVDSLCKGWAIKSLVFSTDH